MKTRYIAIPMIAGALMLTGCNDWLKEEAPGSQDFDDFFTSGSDTDGQRLLRASGMGIQQQLFLRVVFR